MKITNSTRFTLGTLIFAFVTFILGLSIQSVYTANSFKQRLLPPLEVSFLTNDAHQLEAWYTHTPLNLSQELLKKEAAIRLDNLQTLIDSTPYYDSEEEIRTEFVQDTEYYSEYNVYIPTEIGYPETLAKLYVPITHSESGPGILFLHGHFEDSSTFDRPEGNPGNANFHAIEHAKAGFVTLAVENRGTGYFRSQQGFPQVDYLNYELLNDRPLLPLLIRDTQKAYNYLITRDEVAPERIGIAGVSLGGELAGFLGVLNKDASAIVISGYLNLYQGLLPRTTVHDLFWPGILNNVGEIPEIISLIAPRPLLIQQGTDDWEFYTEGYRRNNADEAYKYVKDWYSILDSSNIDRILFEGGHQYHNTSSIEFFTKNL